MSDNPLDGPSRIYPLVGRSSTPRFGCVQARWPTGRTVSNGIADGERAWDEPRITKAVEATGHRKLIIAGVSLEVCVAFPAISALAAGYETYAAVDASGTFSETKRSAGLLRMAQAGVIVSDYATLMVQILKDNARPEAAAVYGALDMPFATLVGQLSGAYAKKRQ